MSFKLAYYDLQRLIKAFGYDEHTAVVVADYLDDIDFDLDLTHYLWNVLPYFVHIFKSKKKALEYVEEQKADEYKLYECENYEGVYLEVA